MYWNDYIANTIENNFIIEPRSFFFCGKAMGQAGGYADNRPPNLPCSTFGLVNVANAVDGCIRMAREHF